MKKLLVLLLIFGITAGAFAQLTTTISLDFNPDIMRVVSPTGDSAKKTINPDMRVVTANCCAQDTTQVWSG
jgi:hypothetical protein